MRPIFICNVAADTAATNFLSQSERAGTPIDLWDEKRLAPIVNQLRQQQWFINDTTKLTAAKDKLFFEGTKTTPSLVYAAIPALELTKLPGISDLRLFAQNVRLGLGSSRVNDEIEESVKNKKEHKNFLTFHNGLTIVAQNIGLRGNALSITNYSVCNGCQSLLAFYENRSSLTPNLEVLVRVVRVGTDRKLPETIAYRTNNQNPKDRCRAFSFSAQKRKSA